MKDNYKDYKDYKDYSPSRHLYKVPFFILTLVLLGSLGYVLIEGWSLLDALYMVVVTLSTIGHGTVVLSPAGRIFTIILVVLGIGVIIYTVHWFTEYIIEGGLKGSLRRRQMDKKIRNLKDHFIIWGCGRVGREIAEEFDAEGVPFIITDKDSEKLKLAERRNWLFLKGEGPEDDVLKELGIEKARGLLSVVDQDAVNVFITLTARALNPDVFIVARANFPETVSKLYRAGADRVSLPHKVGGFYMAALALRPAVIKFLDSIISSKEKDLVIEDIAVSKEMSGKELGAVLRGTKNLTVLAINRRSGASVISPNLSSKLKEGDHFIIMGKKSEVDLLLE